MEDILDVYHRPYDPFRPQVCLDECSKELRSTPRGSLPISPSQPERYDYEYERHGTANIFMFTEPLGGWRHVSVTERHTKMDWALQVRDLLDVRYPNAKRVTLVSDNLNTHDCASLYEAFEPAEARRLMARLDMVHTPKHGSWLNIAEIELNVLARQCFCRMIGDAATLRQEAAVWESDRNIRQKGVDWQFTTADARIKLKRLYPKIQN